MKFPLRYLLSTFAALLMLSETHAIIISGGDGTGNTTGTGAGSGWDYVGSVNGAGGAFNASGVFLGEYEGDYWVLTANHVPPYGLETYTLNGVTYNYVSGSGHQVGSVDLYVFKISITNPEDPILDMSNLVLSGTSPTNTSNVKMVGYGRNRDDTLTTWYVDVNPGSEADVWNTTYFPEANTIRTGYFWESTNTKRWGNNTIEAKVSESGSTYLATDFDNIPGEGQAAIGDSGGGMFYYNSDTSTWELAALTVQIRGFQNQPNETAVYGDSTWGLDIATYRSQILASVPEPGTLGLVGLAVGGFLLKHRRRS